MLVLMVIIQIHTHTVIIDRLWREKPATTIIIILPLPPTTAHNIKKRRTAACYSCKVKIRRAPMRPRWSRIVMLDQLVDELQ